MIEAIVIDYLNENISSGVSVYAEIPENAPDKFVIVQKTGGGRKNMLNSATIAIQSYGPSKYISAELNEEVKELMFNITDLAEISRCALNSDYDFTDSSTKRYRYQAIFNLTHY